MRILHVIPTLAFGGAQRLVINWAGEMRRAGHHADIAVLYTYENAFPHAIAAQGVTVLELGGDLRRYLSWHVLRVLQRTVQEYDIVHAHLFPGQLLVALLQGGPRRVTTEHDTSNRRRGKPVWKLLDRLLYRRYDGIFAISEGVRQALCYAVGLPPQRVQVIANGIPIVPPQPRNTTLRQRLGIPDDAIVICKVARMESPKKNHRLLIEAAALLRARAASGTYHIIFAGDGPSRRDLEHLTDMLGVRGCVHFLGMCSDVHTVLANSDIAAALATWEGFSMAALEAMAQGLPVIASDVPGLNEVVRHAETGLLVDNQSAAALAETIVQLGHDEPLRHRLGQAGLARAKHFSIQKSAENYLNAYRMIVE